MQTISTHSIYFSNSIKQVLAITTVSTWFDEERMYHYSIIMQYKVILLKSDQTGQKGTHPKLCWWLHDNQVTLKLLHQIVVHCTLYENVVFQTQVLSNHRPPTDRCIAIRSDLVCNISSVGTSWNCSQNVHIALYNFVTILNSLTVPPWPLFYSL